MIRSSWWVCSGRRDGPPGGASPPPGRQQQTTCHQVVPEQDTGLATQVSFAAGFAGFSKE